ncbi:hypothetical protein B0G77_8078 [Paraburkholderia sp. BL10I2N1]|nr:hypothetical protein B0G77_8078 [Paraburkholderia sp. BL10I2N1]
MSTCVKGKVMRSLPATLETATPPDGDHAADAHSDHRDGESGDHSSVTGRTRSAASYTKPPGEQLFLQRDLNEPCCSTSFQAERMCISGISATSSTRFGKTTELEPRAKRRDDHALVQFRSVGSEAGDLEVKTKRGVAYLTQDLSGATGTPLFAH